MDRINAEPKPPTCGGFYYLFLIGSYYGIRQPKPKKQRESPKEQRKDKSTIKISRNKFLSLSCVFLCVKKVFYII